MIELGRKFGGWVRVVVGIVLMLFGFTCWVVFLRTNSVEGVMDAGECRVPVTMYEGEERKFAAVVFHGVSANRVIMQSVGNFLAARGGTVYLVDFPGHGDSEEKFSFPGAEACARAVLEKLKAEGKIAPEKTVLVGHSMGGAVAMRMADSFAAGATVAISPAPMRSPARLPEGMVLFDPPKRVPRNLLVLAGEFDPPVVRRSVAEYVEGAGGERTSGEDFAAGRAVGFEIVTGASHTSVLADGDVEQEMAAWVEASVGGGAGEIVVEKRVRILPYVLGLAGIVMLVGPFATGVSRVMGVKAERIVDGGRGGGWILVRWMVAAGVGVGVCYFWLPVGWVRIFSGDYLASFVLVVGVVLCVGGSRWWREARKGVVETRDAAVSARWRAVAVGVVVGMGTILAAGWWMNLGLYDAWMNGERWWRFGVLVGAFLPYLWAEERVVGGDSFGGAAGRAREWGMFLVLRGILWGAMVISLLVLLRGPLLVLLMTMYFVAFSILQRAGAKAIRRRTGSAAAGAVFGAILGAWFVAAAMPLI